jgi:hypothetical protein
VNKKEDFHKTKILKYNIFFALHPPFEEVKLGGKGVKSSNRLLVTH